MSILAEQLTAEQFKALVKLTPDEFKKELEASHPDMNRVTRRALMREHEDIYLGKKKFAQQPVNRRLMIETLELYNTTKIIPLAVRLDAMEKIVHEYITQPWWKRLWISLRATRLWHITLGRIRWLTDEEQDDGDEGADGPSEPGDDREERLVHAGGAGADGEASG